MFSFLVICLLYILPFYKQQRNMFFFMKTCNSSASVIMNYQHHIRQGYTSVHCFVQTNGNGNYYLEHFTDCVSNQKSTEYIFLQAVRLSIKT